MSNEKLEELPLELAQEYFKLVNDKLQATKIDATLSPFEVAELMTQTVGSILATYLTTYVEAPIREYISAKIVFHLA